MEYVLDENGNIKIGPNGKPLVKGKDGKEFEIDAIGAADKIQAANKEAKDRKKEIERLTGENETLTTTNTELQGTADSISADNKVEIEKLKTSINKTWEEKEKTWTDKEAKLNEDLFNAKVGQQFATSEVIKGTVLTPSIAKATFSKHFSSDGTAKDHSGNVIYSKENPGEPATFDEAMAIIIDQHPEKKDILKGSGANGGGSNNGNDGNGPSGDPQKMSAHEKIVAGLKARENA